MRGFTLIEVMAVVVLMGLTAAAVSFSFADRAASVRIEDVTGQLVYHESMARQAARRSGRAVELRFDLDRQRLERLGRGDGAEAQVVYRLPKGFRVQRVTTAHDSKERGKVVVSYSPGGLAESYALLINGPQGRESRLLIVGLTGQPVAMESDEQIEATFALLEPPRDDGGHAPEPRESGTLGPE